MSSINVHCEEKYWGELLPDVHLIQIGGVCGEFVADNGVEVCEERFGLTFASGNDPFIIFSQQPVPCSEEPEIDELELQCTYDSEITGHYYDMNRFLTSCRKSGYDPESDHLGAWISDKIHQHIRKNKVLNVLPII